MAHMVRDLTKQWKRGALSLLSATIAAAAVVSASPALSAQPRKIPVASPPTCRSTRTDASPAKASPGATPQEMASEWLSNSHATVPSSVSHETPAPMPRRAMRRPRRPTAKATNGGACTSNPSANPGGIRWHARTGDSNGAAPRPCFRRIAARGRWRCGVGPPGEGGYIGPLQSGRRGDGDQLIATGAHGRERQISVSATRRPPPAAGSSP